MIVLMLLLDAANMVHVASQKQLSDAKEIIMAINETLNSKFEAYDSILDDISLKMEKMKAQADDSMGLIEDQLTKQMMNISKDLELNLFQGKTNMCGFVSGVRNGDINFGCSGSRFNFAL